MKIHAIEVVGKGTQFVAIVGAASTVPHWSWAVAYLRGLALEAAIGARHVRRVGR